MDKEAMQVLVQSLEKFAEKLGITGQHLWEMLVHQAFFEAIWSFLAIAILAVACYGLYAIVEKHTVTPRASDDNPYPRANWNDEDAKAFAWIGFFGLVIISIIASIFLFRVVLTGLLNPEYWAFMKILDR